MESHRSREDADGTSGFGFPFMMWGMGDGSSDVAQGQRPAGPGEQADTVGGGAAAAAGVAGSASGREAGDEEMYGSDSSPRPATGTGTETGDDAARGRGYNEELGWGQDGWENDQVMDDPWEQDQGQGQSSDDGWFGGGGGGGDFGDFGDWS